MLRKIVSIHGDDMTSEEREVMKMTIATMHVLKNVVAHVAIDSPAKDKILSMLGSLSLPNSPSSAYSEAAADEMRALIIQGSGAEKQ